MTDAANKALVQRLVTEMIQGGDLSLAAAIFDPAYVPHDPSNAVHRDAAPERLGYALYDHALARGWRSAQCYHWTLEFTHSGPLMGIPPSGKAVTVTGIDMFRVSRGKIVESWTYADSAGDAPADGRPAAARPATGECGVIMSGAGAVPPPLLLFLWQQVAHTPTLAATGRAHAIGHRYVPAAS